MLPARLACILPLLWIESANARWKPHVVFILADDYGWANMGKHRKHPQGAAEAQGRSETHTPHLDQLIREGVLLERHYAYKICSPSRSSIQSGRLAVHVNSVNTGVTFWNPEDNVSGFAGIPANMTGLAEKMQHAGYRTHLVGKWDVGMATPLHTPLGKGYDSWLGYFQHANDYWQESMPLASTGNVDICLNKFRDFSLYNRTYRAGVTEAVARELGCNANVKHVQKTGIKPQVNSTGCNVDDPDYCLPDGCFEEAMFNQYALRIIREHDRHKPLFLFYSFHLLHTPLQIPESYLHEIDSLVARSGVPHSIPWTQNRRLYAAMTLYMDTMVGNLISALKERQMYEDTLIVFTADNGGPVYEPGSANNWPLKGGKYSDWEGGVRTNAFVSGGFVPWPRRGTKFGGVISVADWYATLSTIVSVPVHDEKAEEANRYLLQNGLPLLPPVDGRPQWENIVWDINGRKDALHLSQEALLWWPFKLVTGKQPYSFHQGPVYPNCTTEEGLHADEGPIFSDMHVFGVPVYPSANASQQDELTMASDCGYGGCLFNVERDPNEVQDLATDPTYSDVLFEMQKKLYYLNEGNFNPNRGEPAVEACLQAADLGGFYGPFVEVEDFYKKVHLTEEQKRVEAANKKELLNLNETLQKEGEKYVIEFSEEYGLIDIFRPGPNNSIDVCMNDTGSDAVPTLFP